MKPYPVFMNIENRLAVVIGGGEVAYRKMKDLLNSGANIRLISPEINESIKELKQQNYHNVEIINRKYKYGDLDNAYLVFAATNSAEINKSVFKEAEEKHIFINSVDDPPNCTFILPSVLTRGDLTLAVSTGGASPAMAAKLRRMLEEYLPENIEEILEALREARQILSTFNDLDSAGRGAILKKIVDDESLIQLLLEQKRKAAIKDMLSDLLKI